MKILLFNALAIVLMAPVNSESTIENCNGTWVLEENSRDGWGYPETGVINYGTSLQAFWNEPVTCTDEVKAGNFIYYYTKTVVCVPPQLTQLVTVPVGGSCSVSVSVAVPQGIPGIDDPCYYNSGWPIYGSWGPATAYGEVTISHAYKKYVYRCPQGQPDLQKGQGPPCSVE